MSEKQHKATATRLRRAREQGDIAASQEVSRTTGFIGVLVVISFVVPMIVLRINEALKETLAEGWRSDSDVFGQAFTRLLDIGSWALLLSLPLAYFLGAVAGGLLHTKGAISFAKLEPNVNKINPAEGLKKIFSLRGLVDFVRVIVKAVLCGAVLVGTIWGMGEAIALLSFLDISAIAPVAWKALMRLLIAASILYLASAVFDLWFEHYEFAKRNRMTHEEVRQENKDQYGDPHVRGERKALQRESVLSEGLQEIVRFSVVAIEGPGQLLILIGFGKTDSGPALMLLKKVKGAGIELLRGEVMRQSKPIVVEPKLSSELYDRVSERALVPEPLTGELFSILSQIS